jgi:hypothetical protein
LWARSGLSPPAKYHWHRQTIAETFGRIVKASTFPWVAIGDFLDDWRQSAREDRLELVAMGLPPEGDTTGNDLELRPWTSREEYRLSEPWFLYPGDLLRAWQLATTPAPFKMRNIFGGDQMLDRA